jgi:hypothetical protein
MKKNISNNNYTAASIVLFAYVQFSAGIDAHNAAIGSAPTNNKPALNSLFEFAMISNKGVETVGYESFKAIKFEKYNIQAGYQFQILERVKIIPSVSYNPDWPLW